MDRGEKNATKGGRTSRGFWRKQRFLSVVNELRGHNREARGRPLIWGDQLSGLGRKVPESKKRKFVAPSEGRRRNDV